jgi:hypothetical protein
MLANPDYEWKKHPEIKVWRKHNKDGNVNINLESYGPTQSISVFEEALRNNEVFYLNFSLGLMNAICSHICFEMLTFDFACMDYNSMKYPVEVYHRY